MACREQLAHQRLAASVAPQPFEDECRADGEHVGVGAIVGVARVLGEHHDALGEPSRRAQELVDGAAGGEFVESAQRCDDGLFDALSFAAVFRDLEILIGADLLDADEYVAPPTLTPYILGGYRVNIRVTWRISRRIGPEITTTSQSEITLIGS